MINKKLFFGFKHDFFNQYNMKTHTKKEISAATSFFQSCITDVKMNHVRGSGAGDKIRASHSQSDPVAVGKNRTFTKVARSS